MFRLPLPRQFGKIQIAQRQRAAIQYHLALHAVVQGMLDDALDRREAGTTGDEDDRLVAVLAQEEAAQRAFQAQDGLFLHFIEDILRELARSEEHTSELQSQSNLV